MTGIAIHAARGPIRARLRSRGASLGLNARATQDLIRQIETGLPFESLHKLSERSGVSTERITDILGIPPRTLARRKAAGKLTPDESERLLRLSTIFEMAVDLFEGEVRPAVVWLTTPKAALGQEEPLRHSRTEIGAREVEDLIGRMEHGVFV